MRDIGKDLRNLHMALLEQDDKPIFYVSKIYGNKFIVPSEEFSNLTDKITMYEQLDFEIQEILKVKKLWQDGKISDQNYLTIVNGRLNNYYAISKIANGATVVEMDDLKQGD